MGIPKEHEEEFGRFPEVLQGLVVAELAAGNEVAEYGHGSPAAPCGAYIRLARPVTTCLREKTPKLDFYDRNGSSHSGEFTDEQRHFFVLEPPRQTGEYPDTNAIRSALEAKQRVADAERHVERPIEEPKNLEPVRPGENRVETVVDRFRKSMTSDFDSWHDGTGYDLEALDVATPEELAEIETLLLARQAGDWRDIEALGALNSPRARAALKKAMKDADHRLRLAILNAAPDLISEGERTAVLVEALDRSDTYGGLTQALLQIESFHPPQVIDALFRGVLTRGENAVHFAAMLMFLHGKASSSFDWNLRPFFLKFNTSNREELAGIFRELCETIGVDPGRYLEDPPGSNP